MDRAAVTARIEADIEEATAHVYSPRHHDDEDHLGAIVVSPVFDGKSLVDRHQRVYDALADVMTRDIHALEVRTYTPAEFEDADDLELPQDEHP